jgi:hypothetical protein
VNVIYILGDTENSEMIKIGYDSNWPAISEQAKKTIRFEQARSHNPRGVTVHGLWSFGTMEEMKSTERKIHSLLRQYQRTDTHGREWFNIGYQDAVAKILSAGLVTSAALQDPSPRTKKRNLPYDDWRNPSDLYKNEVYKRLLWIFQEESPQKRIKVMHSPLFDTCYKYAFTYNPFHVHLVAAYHDSFFPDGPTVEMRKGNLQVESCWQQIVSDEKHGPGIRATNVGWLNNGATLEWVSEQALKCGLKPYDLSQPKPRCVRPQDGQITTIPVGGTWLQRVRQK